MHFALGAILVGIWGPVPNASAAAKMPAPKPPPRSSVCRAAVPTPNAAFPKSCRRLMTNSNSLIGSILHVLMLSQILVEVKNCRGKNRVRSHYLLIKAHSLLS